MRVIKGLYTNCLSRVKNHTIESEWFSVETGVRQGDVLSPLLFIVFMDHCMREVNSGENEEETLAYADDVAVVTNNITDLERVADKWYQVMRQNDMKINTGRGKTEFMSVSRRNEEFDISIGGNRVNQVTDYSYLGVNINSSNRQEIELNKRISKYNSNLGMMYPLLKDRYIPKECKITIYTAILKPVLIYGSEVWSLTSKTEARIQAAEMRALRVIRGVNKKDRIRNSHIRKDLGVEPLLTSIEKARLRWFGHVKRMEGNRLSRKYLEWQPRDKRPAGRPRKRWMEGVELALLRRGLNIQSIEEERSYEDRTQWRTICALQPTDR